MHLFLLFIAVFISFSAQAAEGKRTVVCLPIEEGLERACGYLPKDQAQCAEPLGSFYQESCLFEKKEELISELIDAPFVDTKDGRFELPLRVLKEHSEESLVKSLLYRVYLHRDLPDIKRLMNELPKKEWVKLWSIYDNVKIQIGFRSSIAEKIKDNGFLNLYQVNASNGYEDVPARLEAEGRYLGINFEPRLKEKKLKNILPKYAYATPVNFSEFISSRHTFTSSYGNVISELKPEVMHFATFTPGDSLLNISNSPEEKLQYTARHLFLKTETRSFKEWAYAEAQVWGQLSRKQIAFSLVNCFTGEGYNSRTQYDHALTDLTREAIEALFRSLKSPVYQCKVTEHPSNPEESDHVTHQIEMKDDVPVRGTYFKLEPGSLLFH